MWLLAERRLVGIGWIAWIGATVVWIGPFRRVRIAGRVVERVMRLWILHTVCLPDGLAPQTGRVKTPPEVCRKEIIHAPGQEYRFQVALKREEHVSEGLVREELVRKALVCELREGTVVLGSFLRWEERQLQVEFGLPFPVRAGERSTAGGSGTAPAQAERADHRGGERRRRDDADEL
jgi:hypothetical protein